MRGDAADRPLRTLSATIRETMWSPSISDGELANLRRLWERYMNVFLQPVKEAV
jgi:hypothetical protein